MPSKQAAYRSVVKSYSRFASRYDRRWRHYNDATIQATVNTLPQEGLRRVLDVGCGTGLLEQALRSQLLTPVELVGVDLTLAMLQEARKKFPHAESPWWANASAEKLPFPDASFDAVVCANAFHYFRQPETALEEFRRLLRPHRWLVLTDWCDDFWACKVCDWFLRRVEGAHFRAYGLEQCQQMLTAAGFHVALARRFKIDWLWGLMILRAQT